MDSITALTKAAKGRSNHSVVIEHGLSILRSNKAQTDVGWNARELLVKALLDEGDVDKAVALVTELRARFGAKSQRVSILEGLTLEAKGEWTKAEKIYEDVLKLNWNNVAAGKRLAAVQRSKGDMNAACKQLNSLITDNQSDVELWSEMCDIQMTVGAFEQALYCAEEILIANPHHYLSNVLCAELALTCAQSQSAAAIKAKYLVDARSNYSQALVLKGEQGYSRAAWGLLICSKTLNGASKSELDEKVTKKAIEILQALYSKSPMKDLVEPVLKQF